MFEKIPLSYPKHQGFLGQSPCGLPIGACLIPCGHRSRPIGLMGVCHSWFRHCTFGPPLHQSLSRATTCTYADRSSLNVQHWIALRKICFEDMSFEVEVSGSWQSLLQQSAITFTIGVRFTQQRCSRHAVVAFVGSAHIHITCSTADWQNGQTYLPGSTLLLC